MGMARRDRAHLLVDDRETINAAIEDDGTCLVITVRAGTSLSSPVTGVVEITFQNSNDLLLFIDHLRQVRR